MPVARKKKTTTRKPTAAQIAKQKMTAHTLLLEHLGWKIGDSVNVLREFEDNEAGCDLDFSESMKDYVGGSGVISAFYEGGGVEVDGDFVWPWFVLEKDTSAIRLNDEHTATVSEDGETVTVGCQEFDSDRVIELADRIKQKRNNF